MATLVEKMKRSPRNIRFNELDRFLLDQGFTATQTGGSHVVYRRDDGTMLTVVRPHGRQTTVHVAAVKQILDVLGL